MSYLGIDVGASFLKAAILDPEQRRIRRVVRTPLPARNAELPGDYFEIDSHAILADVHRLIEPLLAELTAGGVNRCRGVLVCGQMGGVTLTDQRGEALSQFYSWRDLRTLRVPRGESRSQLAIFRERLGDDAFDDLGREFLAGSTTTLCGWLAAAGRLPSPPACPLSIPGFIATTLAHAEPAEELTETAGSLNLRTETWHQTAFDRLGAHNIRPPRVLPFQTPLGEMIYRGHRIPVHPAMGDQQCVLIGAGLTPRELSINVSTGSQVSRIVDGWIPGDYQTRYSLGRERLNTLSHLPSGRALDGLLSLLTELAGGVRHLPRDPWPYIVEQATRAPDCNLSADVAFFSGPMGDSGSLTGLTVQNLTVGSVFRAAFRAMARNYRTCADRLWPDRSWDRIVFSGGLVNKVPLLKEFILEELPTEFRFCSTPEESLAGMLAVAMSLTGVAESATAAGQELQAADPVADAQGER